MKALSVILSALLLCSCGESGGVDPYEKVSRANQEVARIKQEMQRLQPGPELDVQKSKLREAKARYEEARLEWVKSLKK